ncbi:hypothetical protein Cgig2_003300 [Carnegiea gigantea]|uniref:Uncharacterized protein n=1 Tax=Carnegiea gigantea TaxID=171969 RepID=A0A9Q1QCB3_9CARY|nr:hypothetical protein Cgig2_003300 [Carnegiea gigantea]
MYLGIDTNGLLSMHLLSKKNFTKRSELPKRLGLQGFLKRSRQSMLNKTTRPKAMSRHILGSVSAAETAKRLILRFNFVWKAGETPTVAKLFAKDKSFSNDQSKVVWDKYQSLKATKQVPTSQEDDGLFLEAAGGWTEQGTVYRLGNAAEYFYKRPTAGTYSIKPSYTPSIVSHLQNELDSTKAELNSTKNELQ